MKKRNAVITGASQGLGASIAEVFAAAGYRVFVNCAHSVEKAQSVVDKIVAAGGNAEVFQCDIASEKEVCEKFAVLEKRCGGIDILINNAGIVVGKSFNEHSHSDIDRTMIINSSALMHISKEFLPDMIAAKSGHIVNIASAAGLVSNPKMSV